MTIHLYKPTVEISIEGSVTSQEKANALEISMAIITNRGLVSLNVQDIATVTAGCLANCLSNTTKALTRYWILSQ